MRIPGLATGALAVTLAWPGTGCVLLAGPDDDLAAAGDDGDDDSPTGPTFDPARSVEIDVDACTEGLSRPIVDDTLEIVFDFESSAHEMIACGGLVTSIVATLVFGILELAQDPDSSTLPEQYQWDGAGTYTVRVDSARDLTMQVRFYLAQDFAFGKRGDLVTHNLFDLSTFLLDPHAEVDVDVGDGGLDIDIEITHAGPGPLVELLGLGPDPASPIRLGADALEHVQTQLRNLEVEALIRLADHPGVSTIEYEIASPRVLADALLGGSALPLDMVAAAGWRDDLGQDLDIDRWTVEYVGDGPGALDGDIGFTVRGGPFDFAALLTYERSSYPKISIGCAP